MELTNISNNSPITLTHPSNTPKTTTFILPIKNISQISRPYYSKPIVYWSKCKQINKETNVNNKQHSIKTHNYYIQDNKEFDIGKDNDSSDDDSNDDDNNNICSKQLKITSMGFELHVNNITKSKHINSKECICDENNSNSGKCIDDVPLFALVGIEDSPKKNESRNYNNINSICNLSNMNDLPFQSKNISSVGMSNTSQFDYDVSNGAKISMKDLICETDYNSNNINNNNKDNNNFFYEKVKQYNSKTNSNKISINNTITNTSTKQNSSLKTSQLHYSSNNSSNMKPKQLLKSTLIKTHRAISSLTNKHMNTITTNKIPKTPRPLFTSKIHKVIQHKLSNFILNQKDNEMNGNITKISLATLSKRTKMKHHHHIKKHNKHLNNNCNTCLSHRMFISKNNEFNNIKNTNLQNDFFYKHSTIYNTLLTN